MHTYIGNVMDPLTIAAASGLRARMESLDLLSNNLANAQTSGYKSDRAFYSLYASEANKDPFTSNPSFTLPVIERQWTDFTQGTLLSTGNSTDVALSGNGFFAVNGPAGPLYTRNGNFRISTSGELTTGDGYTLRTNDGRPIRVAAGKPVEISKEGVVSQAGQLLGRLEIVSFRVPESLTKVGNTCFQNTDASNPPVEATDVEVQQGKLENSNVPVAEAAMRLVETMRQFEMLQKAVALSGDMNRKTIEEVARVT